MKKRTAALIGMAAVLLLLAGVFCGAAAAAGEETSGTSGGIDWNITDISGGKKLTISPAQTSQSGFNPGQMVDYSSHFDTPWDSSKGSLTALEIKDGVTTIGNNAFQYCSGFKGSLAIPNSVTRIGNNAFESCRGFTGSLIIPDSVTTIGESAFEWCKGFTGELTIGNSVKTIEVKAFYGCSGFTGELTIGSSVETIRESAFEDCSGFTGELIIPDSVKTIGEEAFERCKGFNGSLTIGDSVTTIGTEAFQYCDGFKGPLTIGNSVTTIGVEAFYNCSGFTGELTIPNSVKTIGNSAFFNCSGFTGELTIGSSVTTIGTEAFKWCTGFTGSLSLPNSVETIGEKAFEGCKGFNGSLTIGDSVTTIGTEVFSGCTGFKGSLIIGSNVETIGEKAFQGCKFTGSLVIPDSVKTIKQWAFEDCRGFTGSLTIGSSVTTIGEWAFSDCSGFTGSLTIGRSVETIGNYAFNGCSGFKGSLSLPNSVKTIGEKAFYGCTGFTGSLFIPESVTSIGTLAFSDCSAFDIIYIAGDPSLIDNKYPSTVPLAATYSGTIKSFPAKPNLATPEKTACTFKGWYKNADFSGEQVTTYEASGKYYAKWSSNTTSVTFKNGESTYAEQTYTKGQTFSLPTAPTGTGTFLGWRVGSTSGDFFSFYHGTTNIFLPDSLYYTAGKWTSDTPTLTLCAAWDAAAPTPASRTVTAVAGAGGSINVTPTSPVTVGTPVTLTAAANSGYHFKEWQNISGLPFSISTDNPLKFFMPNNDVSVTAVFEADTPGQTYTVTASTDGHGSITGTPTNPVAPETPITLTATADSGYHFKQWVTAGLSSPVSTAASLTFSMPAKDVSAVAEFEADAPAPANHKITVETGIPGGSASATYAYAPNGTEITITAYPKNGYKFSKWTVTGATVSSETTNPATFTVGSSDVTVTAVFEIINKSITIDPEGNAPVNEYAVPFSDGEGVSVRVISATNLNGEKGAAYKAKDETDKPVDVTVYSIFNFQGEVKANEKSVLTVEVTLPPSSTDTLKDTICLEMYKDEQWIQIKPTGEPTQSGNVYTYTFEVKHYCPLAIVSDTSPSGSYTLSIPSEVNLEKGTSKSAEVGVTLTNWTEADGKVSVTLDSDDVEGDEEGDKKTKFFLKLNGSPETKAYYQIKKSNGSPVEAGNIVLGPVPESIGTSESSYIKENLIFSFTDNPPVAGTYTGTITFTASVSH